MAELPRLRVGLTLDSQTFIRETNRVIDSVNNLGRQMERQNRSMAQSLRGLEDGVGRVGGALRALGAVVGVGSFAALAKQAIDAADAYTILQGRLRLVSENADAAAEAQSRLVQIAATTRTSLQAVTDLYARLSLTLQDAGVKSEELLQVTEAVAQASRLAGGSAASIAAGIFQFSQAMGSGVLRGQELISVMEQVPGLAVALSRGLNVPIAQFKRLGEEGFFTSERVLNALLDQLPELSREADRMGTTVGQAFQQLRDSLTLAIGEVSETTGASRDLAESIIGIADALRSPELIQALETFVTGFLEEMHKRIETTRKDWQGLLDLFSTTQDFLSQFRLADPQSLDAINSRIADINTELARMIALNRETAAGPEKAVRQSVIVALSDEREALVKRRSELEANAKAATETAKATDALTLSVRRAAKIDIAGESSLSEKQLAFNRAKLKREYEALAKIAEDTIKRGNRAIFQETEKAERARIQANDRLNDQILREQERIAERQQELIIRPFENALDNVQGLFTDTFEEIYSGGITSFEDLAGAVKDIFVRLAAELTTLMIFKPVLQAQAAGTLFAGLGGSGGAGTATGALAALGGGFMTSGGQFIPNVRSPQVAGWNAGLIGGTAAMNPAASNWWMTPQRGFGGLAAAGGAGFLGGSMLGGFTGSSTGGGVGGALGAVAGTALLGPLGGIAGGVLGGLSGGAIGGLFGGGPQSNNVAFGRGALGAIGGGTGAGGQFIRQLDQQILGVLDARMVELANAALVNASNIAVKYSKTPSANDLERLAAGRIGPTAAALGFNAGAIATGTPEQQIANLQTAVALMRQIEGFRIGPIATQFRDLDDTFAEMGAEAARLGVSTEGLAEAHQREAQALTRRIHMEQIAVAATVGALDPITAQFQTLERNMQEASARAQELGISMAGVAAAHQRAAQALARQIQLEQIAVAAQVGALDPIAAQFQTLERQMQGAAARAQELGISTADVAVAHQRAAEALARQIQLQQVAVATQIGALDPLNAALQTLEFQMREAAAQARELGLPLDTITAAHHREAQIIIQRDRIQRHGLLETIGLMSALDRALADLDANMRIAWREAERLGYSTANIAREHHRLADALIRENQAAQDALALSITSPFEQLMDPLREFLGELQIGNLNPAGQMRAAADEFHRIAALATAGSTTAIQQLQGAGEAFIAQAERFGASPAGVAARTEVASVIGQVMGSIEQAQREASAGVEDAIRVAQQRNGDKLNEVVAELVLVKEEIKRLRR